MTQATTNPSREDTILSITPDDLTAIYNRRRNLETVSNTDANPDANPTDHWGNLTPLEQAACIQAVRSHLEQRADTLERNFDYAMRAAIIRERGEL